MKSKAFKSRWILTKEPKLQLVRGGAVVAATPPKRVKGGGNVGVFFVKRDRLEPNFMTSNSFFKGLINNFLLISSKKEIKLILIFNLK